MARKKGRFFRPKSKDLIGTKYDSHLEKRLHEGPFKDCEFHTKKITYYIQHDYNPDFIYTTDDFIEFLIEAKGYFQDSKELQKYKWIKDQLAENQILVLVFENPHKPIHFQKKRKDGTKMTHAEWAEKLGIMWISENEAGRLMEN